MGGTNSPQLNDILLSDNQPDYSNDDRITLQLNGHDRFSPQHHRYFTERQVYDYHSGMSDLSTTGGNLYANLSTSYVYSFALKPEEHQPSGTCNFSRIDNAKLIIDIADADASVIKVFAVNYNVLRIMSGMGGLAYSN